MTTENDTPKLDPALEPPEGTIVQTGDEEMPSAEGGKHDDHLKAIFKKGRENRELVTREDQDENPDAELIAKMVAESQDDGEFEHPESQIDLDARPNRFDDGEESEDPEFVEVVDHEAPEVETKAETDEIEEQHAQKEPEVAKNLDYDVNNGKVKCKIEGKEFLVPVEDIESAGGLELYQMRRAANIRFEKAATYGKALQKEKESLATRPQPASTAKGELPEESDVLNDKAELERLREEVLDAALDGSEADVDEVLRKALSRRRSPASEPQQNSPGGVDPAPSDRVVEEFETAYKQDRAQANRLLMDEFSDIINDEDLNAIAHRKYLELDADPSSVGRTAVEMAREAGNFVRRLTNSKPKREDSQDTEMKLRREKKRVLPQPSQARSKSRPPEQKKPRSSRDYIRDIQRAQGNRTT